MTALANNTSAESPIRGQNFVEKIARSIAEVHPTAITTGDIVTILEALGYSDKSAVENGFRDLAHLSRKVADMVGFFLNKQAWEGPPKLAAPSKIRATFEALGVAFPWIAAWIVLWLAGVSLWMATVLPAASATFLFLGVYIGLFVAWGQSQAFGRLFSFYFGQANVSETRRVVSRGYVFLSIALASLVGSVFFVSERGSLPIYLPTLTLIGAATIGFGIASYMMIYALKKLKAVVASFTSAIVSLAVSYNLLAELVMDPTTRYVLSLSVAFVVLEITPIYYHFKVLSGKPPKSEQLSFYRPVSVTKKTISSSLSVQLWEIAPYWLFGAFFFLMLLGDRMVSWVLNPAREAIGTNLPILFNPVYHAGADLALFALLPSMVIQYVMLSSIHSEIYNLSIELKVREAPKVGKYLEGRYARVIIATVLVTAATSTALAFFGPTIIRMFHGTSASVPILYVASVANIFMAGFSVNATFLGFLNRIKALVLLALAGALIVLVGGFAIGVYGFGPLPLAPLKSVTPSFVLALSGFERIVLAYLASAVVCFLFSLVSLQAAMKKAASTHFAKFV